MLSCSAVEVLKPCKPSYVSVTYGAGGSTRDRTLALVSRIKNELGIEAMARRERKREYDVACDDARTDLAVADGLDALSSQRCALTAELRSSLGLGFG